MEPSQDLLAALVVLLVCVDLFSRWLEEGGGGRQGLEEMEAVEGMMERMKLSAAEKKGIRVEAAVAKAGSVDP